MDSGFRDLLSEKRSVILKRWFEKLLESYPADSVPFLKDTREQFRNPVGHTVLQGLEAIFDALLGEADLAAMKPALEGIMRIRAVQGLKPSQDLAFLFHLKGIVKETIAESTSAGTAFAALESRIDAVALLSFDIYMGCREKIFELKSEEVKNRTFRLLQMANLVSADQKP